MVLLDLVSLLLLSVQCILPRKRSLALRPSGVKRGLGLLSVLQRLLQTGCASWQFALQYHTVMVFVCLVLGPSCLPAGHVGKAALVWGSVGGFLKL